MYMGLILEANNFVNKKSLEFYKVTLDSEHVLL